MIAFKNGAGETLEVNVSVENYWEMQPSEFPRLRPELLTTRMHNDEETGAMYICVNEEHNEIIDAFNNIWKRTFNILSNVCLNSGELSASTDIAHRELLRFIGYVHIKHKDDLMKFVNSNFNHELRAREMSTHIWESIEHSNESDMPGVPIGVELRRSNDRVDNEQEDANDNDEDNLARSQ